MAAGKLLVVGYLSIDTVTDTAGRSRRMPGGACLYAGLGARHAGAEVALAASVGADYPGYWIEALASAGLDLTHLSRKSALSRHADIRHFADGRRVSTHYRDPEWWVSSAEHAPEWPADLSNVGMIVAGPMPVSQLARLVEDARGQGVPVVADTSEAFARADPGGILQLIPALSVFAPSREETRLLYPGMGDEDAARRLSSMGPAVVQKLGADGLRVVSPGGREDPSPAGACRRSRRSDRRRRCHGGRSRRRSAGRPRYRRCGARAPWRPARWRFQARDRARWG